MNQNALGPGTGWGGTEIRVLRKVVEGNEDVLIGEESTQWGPDHGLPGL